MIHRPWTSTFLVLAAFAATIACAPSPAPDDSNVSVELLTGKDLHAIVVTGVGEREARVYLPTDIRLGDSFSGAIERGDDDPLTPRDSARDTPFSRYAVVVGESAVPLSERYGKWVAPTTGTAIDVVVRHADGREIGTLRVPFEVADSTLSASQISASQASPPTRPRRIDTLPRLPDSTVVVTSLAVQGRGVVAIAGKFDGDIGTSRGRLERDVRILAESPRRIVLFDRLILRGGPQRVTCCAEGGPCGLTSCCVDIPSNGCTFCQFNDYPVCITGPVTPG